MKPRSILAAVSVLLGGLAGLDLGVASKLGLQGGMGMSFAAAREPAWSEVAWPFPMDQWGKGKAFVCKATDCGVELTVYIRAKIGFCNCTTGVADDEELDRISDFDLFENKLTALGAGKPIAVAWMKGRSRAFAVGGRIPNGWSALSVGFNDHCDAIIATALVGGDQPQAAEQTVLDFLNSRTVLRWAELTLGL
jgi:hypothetical protein